MIKTSGLKSVVRFILADGILVIFNMFDIKNLVMQKINKWIKIENETIFWLHSVVLLLGWDKRYDGGGDCLYDKCVKQIFEECR